MRDVMQGTCERDGCTRQAKRRLLCDSHYVMARRAGTLTVISPHRPKRGTCIADGCARVDSGRHGLCNMHYLRSTRHDDYLNDARWRGDNISYETAHRRVRATRGPASHYACVDCGFVARQWSYDHGDSNEKRSASGPYSTDASHYHPRCVPCHKRYDLALSTQ